MRVLPCMILCLFMAVYVQADDEATDNAPSDFVLGERTENDRLLYKKLYVKFPSKYNPTPTVKIPVTTIRKNQVITQIKLHNTRDQQATITVLKGEIGQRFLLLRAEAKFEEILSVSVEVYVSDAPQPTPLPSTTEESIVTDAPAHDETTVDASTGDASADASTGDASADDAPADD